MHHLQHFGNLNPSTSRNEERKYCWTFQKPIDCALLHGDCDDHGWAVLKQVINLEWGNFRSPYLPRTFADEEVDRDSVNPGDQVKVAFVFRVVCKRGRERES